MSKKEVPKIRGSVHKPCVFNPQGADERMCKEISGIPARANLCNQTSCTSVWRARVNPEDPSGGLPTHVSALESSRVIRTGNGLSVRHPEPEEEEAPILLFDVKNSGPLEASDAIHAYCIRNSRLPMRAVAECFGCTEVWIGKLRKLQKLHPDVRKMLGDQWLTTKAAIQISRLDRELQIEAAQKIVAAKISSGQLRHVVIETDEANDKTKGTAACIK